MTINSATNHVTYDGDGTTTSFSFSPIVIQDADQLEVTKLSGGDYTVLTRGSGSTNYTVTVSEYPGTGTVTYPSTGTANVLSASEDIIIRRKDELLQEVDLYNQGGYFPETLETALDLARIIDQQQQNELDRSIKAPVGDARTMTLPQASDRASKYLSFDADGDVTVTDVLDAGDLSVSSFVETLLDDTTAVVFNTTLTPSGVWTTSYTDNGATPGQLILDRITASAADDDQLWEVVFRGRNDNATPQAVDYAVIRATSADVSDNTEDGRLRMYVVQAGALTEVVRIGPDAVFQVKSEDDGATASPLLALWRDSESPVTGDIGPEIEFGGNDSGGNYTDYAAIELVIQDPTNASEDGYLQFRQMRAGSEVKMLSPGILYTAQSASGSAVAFTGIPATARRITLMISGVGTNGTAAIRAQLGDSGGLETTDYLGGFGSADDATSNSNFSTSGAILTSPAIAAESISGQVVFTLLDPATNTWVWSGCTMNDDTTDIAFFVAGSKALSATLDRISVISTDTFDEGLINILVE